MTQLLSTKKQGRHLGSASTANVGDFDPAGSAASVLAQATAAASRRRTVSVSFDGDSWPIEAPRLSNAIRLPVAGTLTKITLMADVAGAAVVDIWKAPLSGLPLTVANTIITTGTKPTISTAISMEDSTLTGYVTVFAPGDVIQFNLESCTTCTKLSLVLEFV